MDQAARWRTGSSGQKGPFTVDSGGGNGMAGPSTGVGRVNGNGRTAANGTVSNGFVTGGSPSANSLASMRGAAMGLVGGLGSIEGGGQIGMTGPGASAPSWNGAQGSGLVGKDPRVSVSRQSSISSNSSRMEASNRSQQPGPSTAPYHRPAPPSARNGNINAHPHISTSQSFPHRQPTPSQSPNASHATSPAFAVPLAGPMSASSSRPHTPAPALDVHAMQNQVYSSSPTQSLSHHAHSTGNHFHHYPIGGQASSVPSMSIEHGPGQAQRRQKTAAPSHPYSRSGSSTPLDPPPSPFGYDGFPLSTSANLQPSHFPSSFTPTPSGWSNGRASSAASQPPPEEAQLAWNAFQPYGNGAIDGGGVQFPQGSSSRGHGPAQPQSHGGGNDPEQEFLAALSASMPNHTGSEALSSLSSAELTQLLSGLAREESSSEFAHGSANSGNFASAQHQASLAAYRAMQEGARVHEPGQHAIPPQLPIGQPGSQGPSLLSRRMQQYRGDEVAGGKEGENGPEIPQSSMASGPNGVLPTPPASFSSTFAYPPGRLSARPTPGWGPDRGVLGNSERHDAGPRRESQAFNESRHGFDPCRPEGGVNESNSPRGLSLRHAKSIAASDSSRPPSAPASPHQPRPPFGQSQPHQQQGTAAQHGFSYAMAADQVDLPPLPAGIDIEQLAQFGAAGLEMAIRMGMGIGMGLGQAAGQAGKAPEINSPLIQQQLAALLGEASGSPQATMTSSPFSGSASGGQRNTPIMANDGFKTDIVAGILGEDFFTHRNPSTPGATPGLSAGGPSMPPSRRESQSGDTPGLPPAGAMSPIQGFEGEPSAELLKKDPLAAQVWKAYAKAKGGLPSGPRMENLTWRLMHMTLKKPDGSRFTPLPGFPMTAVAEEQEEPHPPRDVEVVEETARGRGRSQKGKGKVVGFQAASPQGQGPDDPNAMDWRAPSRSRSRVSVMDWRPQSRSRSRSTFGRKAYDYASEAQSHALLAQNGGLWPDSEDLLLNGMTQTFPGEGGEWHLSQIMASMQEGAGFNQADSSTDPVTAEHASDEDFLAGIASYLPQFADIPQSAPVQRGRPSQLPYDRAIKAAASAYDDTKFPGTGSPEGSQPATRKAAYATLPGISGPGLVDRSEENYHPQYGYLPRRVRKTSFDHTVAQEESGQGLLPPPTSAKSRKRPAEGSPAIQSQNVPAPPMLELPTAEALQSVPGSFPSTSFTFAVPQAAYDHFFDMNAASSSTPVAMGTGPLPPVHGNNAHDDAGISHVGADDAQAWLNNLSNALANEAPEYYSGERREDGPPGSPPIMTEMQAALLNGHPQAGDAYQFQQMMQSYLQPDMLPNPFMTVNPTQILGSGDASNHHRSGYSSPTDMPAHAVAPDPQMPPPTRPLPKSVGGKAVAKKLGIGPAKPPGPHRSNSSPNLANLKLTTIPPVPILAGKAGSGHVKSASVSLKAPVKTQANASSGAQSGDTTPTSEDGGPGSIIVGGDAPTSCTNCKTRNTPLWRRDPDGQPLCNACGLFYKLHGVVRPLSLKTDVIKKRNRAQPAKDGSSVPARKNSLSAGKAASGAKSKASSPIASGASGSAGPIGIPARKIRRGGSEGESISASPVTEQLGQFSTSAGSLSMTSLASAH